ncbi:hypothetical protein RGQ29_003700 [Quercus rubra]|uniref:Uncharacterized protein n=1 Tax=Quercus rubra TaxID=3512 RepID=A0AAN7ED98_QUERU|nr:hypothetical protein RGQ29_003700 [Quercus rubra]
MLVTTAILVSDSLWKQWILNLVDSVKFCTAGTSTTPVTTTPSTTTPSTTTPSTTTPTTTTPTTASPYTTTTPSNGVLGGIGTGIGPSGVGINTDDSHGGLRLADSTFFSFFMTILFTGLMFAGVEEKRSGCL